MTCSPLCPAYYFPASTTRRKDLATSRIMCSSWFFSLNSSSSTLTRSRFLKKAKATCLKSRVRSGNGRSARLKKRSHSWEEDMKMVNFRLYLKNNRIMEENKRLRERALLLSLENQALQSHIQGMNKSNICTLQS